MNKVAGEFDKVVDPPNRTILIIDDEPANLAVVGDYLAQSGFQIKVARTGEAGLELTRRTPPDLILLDVRLPGVDGFEVCRRLKADERTWEIPVLFMTVLTSVEDKVKGFEVGGVDYITKPFQREEVLARVTTHLRLRDLTRRLEEAKEGLERRVVERTSELAQANVRLKKEITERQRAEEALKEQYSTLRSIIDSANAPIFSVDRQYRYTSFNQGHAAVMQALYGAEIQIGYSLLDYMTVAEDRETAKHNLDRALAGEQLVEEAYSGEELLSRQYFRVSHNPINSEAGQVIGVAVLAQDMTERKRVEDQLRQSEHYKTIQNQIASIFLAIPDEEMYREVLGVVLQVMKSKFGVFGFIETNGDLVIPGMTRGIWNECQVPDKSIVFPQDMWGASLWGRAIREKRALYSNGPFHTPEGHIHIDHFLTAPIVFGNETIGLISVANREQGYTEEDKSLLESIVGYISPILNARLQRDRQEHERRRAEEALRKSEAGLKEAQRLGRLGSWEWDAATDTITWSEEYYRIYGFDPQQRPPGYVEHLQAYTPASAARLDAAVKRNMETGEPYMLDLELARPDSPSRWITARSETKRDADGRIVGLRGTAQDITERKRAEEEIRQLNQGLEQRVADRTAQLEAANKELEAFAYSISHDLRAPLRHVDGFLELLRQSLTAPLDERSQHYMTSIADSARRMGVLIDDLLAFSRMGRNELSKKPVDLGSLVQEVIQELAPEMQNRSINWRIADLPTVTGDRAMLRLALVNLLANALKFTRPRPQADIEIGCLPGGQETVVFIRDNGVGFDMAYADKLFGVFQRLHRVEEFEGTGIGLANVRRIITRHGGRTWAEGEVDQGATFYLALP